MIATLENIISTEKRHLEPKIQEDYLQSSGGLFLNATSIISGTCSGNEQELEQANRISGSGSPIKSPVKVSKK